MVASIPSTILIGFILREKKLIVRMSAFSRQTASANFLTVVHECVQLRGIFYRCMVAHHKECSRKHIPWTFQSCNTQEEDSIFLHLQPSHEDSNLENTR